MYGQPNLGAHISVPRPVKQHYSGRRDKKCGLYEGIGSLIYTRDDYIQKYEGKFIWNNMHGCGEYEWQPLGHRYEGRMYVNKKEGYGRLSYPSGAYFEGLYRDNQRFGPGIYTDAAGYQDVGIWVNSKLIRLSRTIELDKEMPRLAVTNEDKIRVSQYRQIIHFEKNDIQHLSENLLEFLTHLRNYDKSVVARSEELYNPLCRDCRAPSFNRPRYDRTYSENETDEFTIDVLMTEEEIQEKIASDKRRAMELGHIPDTVASHMHNPKDAQSEESFSNEIAAYAEKKGEAEADYCGIKLIDPNDLSSTLLTGDYRDQWHIFQCSAINMAQRDISEKSDASSINENTVEEKIDDFGRKEIGHALFTKKVIVTDLMAWNNSPVCIELLKHVFKHRNFEKRVTFDISKILAGRRGCFRQEGAHEKAALELLKACSDGFENRISRLILENNLDVDVADGRGNTGLLLAAARDRLDAIDVLLDLGANVDSVNDECLTALGLCILRLLEVVNGVTDWSKAFLPNRTISESTVEDNSITSENYKLQWHGRISYDSLPQQMPKIMDRELTDPQSIENDSLKSENLYIKSRSLIGGRRESGSEVLRTKPVKTKIEAEQQVLQKLDSNRHADQHYRANDPINQDVKIQKYIFDMSPIIGSCISQSKARTNKLKNRKSKCDNKTNTDERINVTKLLSPTELLENSKRILERSNSNRSPTKAKVYFTILKLLDRHANPNLTLVPYPVLVMSIFTKMPNLVSRLLQCGADPDTTLSKADYCLTPLLILAVLEPSHENVLIAQALLKAKADPSIRADPNYRSDLLERLKLNRRPEFMDNSQGVTALHLLAIRPDMNTDINNYLGKLIKIIYQDGCITNSDLYQGHSPLSLAIFEGNLMAVKALLQTTCIDVNEQLGEDLGNAMLMLESCILQKLLPSDLLQEILELLLEYHGCPFATANVLEEEYNQIEYGREELNKMTTYSERTVETKDQKNKIKSKGPKTLKTPNTISFTKSIDFIKKTAKDILIRRIRANFVRELINSPILLVSEGKSANFREPLLKNALTWMTAEEVAVVMKIMNCDRSTVTQLVNVFVTACILHHGKTSSNMNKLIQSETERIVNTVMPMASHKEERITGTNVKTEKGFHKEETKCSKSIVVNPPECDPECDKFKVCFQCLSVHRKVLILCPECKQVYFCTEECNVNNSTQHGNPHQCPVFYQKEWARLERIAIALGKDPIIYMLQRFENPAIYVDIENKTARYIEIRGKRNLKNKEGYTNISTPKCTEPAGQLTDGDEYKDKRQVESVHARTSKYQNKNIGIEDEDQYNNMKSRIGSKQVQSLNKGDLIANDNIIKASKGEKADHVGSNNKLSNAEKNISSDIKPKKGVGRNFDNNNDKAVETGADRIKSKRDMKDIHLFHQNDTERFGGNKINTNRILKGKHAMNNDKVERDINNINIALQKGKHKIRVIDGNKDSGNSKLRGKNAYWLHKKDDVRSHYLYNNNNLHGKYKGTFDTKEHSLNNRSNKTDKHAERGNNVRKKYLDCLLKVSGTAGEHFDIDSLLLPYVVFAQGDIYFKIPPANQYPKCLGNYSLI